MRLSQNLSLAAALFSGLTVAPMVAQTVVATADTYVNLGETASSTVYGTATTLATANDGGSFGLPKGGDRFILFRFDLTSFASPFELNQVSLDLEKTSGLAASFDVYAIPDLAADEFFDEATYTFDTSSYAATTNAPSHDGGLDKDLLLNLGSFSTVTGADSISFTSSALVDFLNDDTNNMATFIIWQSTQEKSARLFASREHATLAGPTLSAVPEPATAGLLAGLAALLFANGRRRRSG